MLSFQARVITGLATAAGYLVLGIILFRQNRFRDWTGRIAGLYLVLSIAWSVAHAVAVWQGLVPGVPPAGAQIASDLVWVLPTLILILTLQFLDRPGVKSAAILGGVWIALSALAGLNVLGLQETLVRLRVGSTPAAALNTLRIIGWVSLSISALTLAGFDFQRTRRPLHRNRLMFWLIALFLTQLGEGLTLIPPVVLDPPQIGLGVRLLGVTLLTVAITSYNLPNLRAITRRALAAVLLTLLSGALYLGSFLLFQGVRDSALGAALAVVIAAGIALGLAVIQQPMLRIIQNLLDRFVYRQQYDPARALREYNAAISNILDLHLLVSVAVGMISEALDVRRGALILITELPDGGVDARLVKGMGEIEVDHFDLGANSPILADLRAVRQPLTQYEIDILPKYRVAPQLERAYLQALNLEVYVPIRSQSLLIGVFALGHKASGDPYTATDLDVLMTVADQTAVALQNARLVTDLKQANTAITQLNDELTRANRRLERLDQAKSDFIQIASHELRTPLTQVRGYADILADSVREGSPSLAQVGQISQGIGRATLRLEEIITAMLDVSQIDSEALSITRTPLAMTSVLRFALDNYRDAVKQRKQTLVVEGIDDLPPIQGDFQRLCQAFSNVIGNCIKYTPDGGKISVIGRTINEGPGGDSNAYLEVVIADSGIGIDREDQELIFEKFYRVGPVELHSSGQTKFKGGGPGLGLPIAKGVIQAHGGKIWVESDGQDESRYPGSKFHIILPAAPASVIAEFNPQTHPIVAPFTTAL
ncbi:MAG TPA: ATP-binding protein [Anaerolineae bacterium]|nr:ATP-binding protein [Anaerolineae bacterium]